MPVSRAKVPSGSRLRPITQREDQVASETDRVSSNRIIVLLSVALAMLGIPAAIIYYQGGVTGLAPSQSGTGGSLRAPFSDLMKNQPEQMSPEEIQEIGQHVVDYL